MIPTYIPNHAGLGLGLLLEQFKGSPYMRAILASYLNRAQELEDAILEVYVIRGIDASEGVNLDTIGRLVLRYRLGLVDVEYRVALKVEILINRSSGTPDELLKITRLSAGLGPTITYQEAYQATVLIHLDNLNSTQIPTIFDSLFRAKCGGVRLILTWVDDNTPNAFTFAPGTSAVADTAHGWSDDVTAPTMGGYWIYTIASGP